MAALGHARARSLSRGRGHVVVITFVIAVADGKPTIPGRFRFFFWIPHAPDFRNFYFQLSRTYYKPGLAPTRPWRR